MKRASEWYERYAALARQAVGDTSGDLVVVGHSGAGVTLPLLATSLHAGSVVFVDALVPSADGTSVPGEPFRQFVAPLVRGDRLLPWSQWWPAEDLAEVVPDPSARAALVAEEPRLPAGFYDVPVPAPDGWDDGRAVHYLRLSAGYAGDADEARARGWPVTAIDTDHLHMLVAPEEIADYLGSVTGR